MSPGSSYAPEALMSEKEMAEELESSQHHRIQMAHSSTGTANALVWGREGYESIKTGLHSRVGCGGATAAVGHSEYVPPPLPPVMVTKPIFPRSRESHSMSPYADDAMIAHPPLPKVTPYVPNSGLQAQVSKSNPTRPVRPIQIGGVARDDDEPSVLHLGNSLTVDYGL
ncbi:hypothetical protein BGZ83_000744, partial [Gryganskiella cystojenkinii]